MARIDDTTREALIASRYADLCERPDMTAHERGCEDAACVDRCKRGHCRCAGCEPHLDDWFAALEDVAPAHVATICEAHGVAVKAFWDAAGVGPGRLPLHAVERTLREVAEAQS